MRLLTLTRYLCAGAGGIALIKRIAEKISASGKGGSEGAKASENSDPFMVHEEYAFNGEASDLMTLYLTLNQMMDKNHVITVRDLLSEAISCGLIPSEDIPLAVFMNTTVDKYGWTQTDWDPEFGATAEDNFELYIGKPFYLA